MELHIVKGRFGGGAHTHTDTTTHTLELYGSINVQCSSGRRIRDASQLHIFGTYTSYLHKFTITWSLD